MLSSTLCLTPRPKSPLSIFSAHLRVQLTVSCRQDNIPCECKRSICASWQVPDIARAMELGKEAADFVSATFIKPIKLEFEKARARTDTTTPSESS